MYKQFHRKADTSIGATKLKRGLCSTICKLAHCVLMIDLQSTKKSPNSTPNEMLPRRSSGSLYKLLEVEPSCSVDDLKKAYRKIALKIHPDKTGGTTTVEFQRVKAAHDVLSNPEQRKLYDTFGSEGMAQMQRFGMEGVPVDSSNMVRFVSIASTLSSICFLVQLSLIVAKIDQGKDWSWTHILAPFWIVLSLCFLFVVITLPRAVKELKTMQIISGSSLLFFCVGLSLMGHAICGGNTVDDWRTTFWAGFFPALAFLTVMTLHSLSVDNVKTFLSVTPTYRYKLDLIEHLTMLDAIYLKFALPALFDLSMTLFFYATWYMRAATTEHASMSFWDVFAPLLIRLTVNMLMKIVVVLQAASDASSGNGYTPVGEDLAEGRPKRIHALAVPLLYAPGIYTICMISAKLEAELNLKGGYDPSAGVCCIFLFIVSSLWVLLSCCGVCFSPIPAETASQEPTAPDAQAEEGEATSQVPEGQQPMPPDRGAGYHHM